MCIVEAFAASWIEMSEIDIYDRLGASKPLRLRGLKSELLQHLSIAGRSKPLRLRGLKFKGGKSVICLLYTSGYGQSKYGTTGSSIGKRAGKRQVWLYSEYSEDISHMFFA